jgi:DNA-binding NarL/FixJ family response regulator
MLAFMEILLEGQFEVVASVTDGEALVLAAQNLAPDVVVLDFSLSFLDGLSAGRRLQELAPSTKVVFFSSHEDSDYATAAFEVGAVGYLVKHLTGDLSHCLQRIMQGERVQCPEGLAEQASGRPKK